MRIVSVTLRLRLRAWRSELSVPCFSVFCSFRWCCATLNELEYSLSLLGPMRYATRPPITRSPPVSIQTLFFSTFIWHYSWPSLLRILHGSMLVLYAYWG